MNSPNKALQAIGAKARLSLNADVMWIKKTDAEIAAARRKHRMDTLVLSVFLFLTILCLYSALLIFGVDPDYKTLLPISEGFDFADLQASFPRIFAESLVVSIVFSLLFAREKTFICPVCDKIRKNSNNRVCSCGGEYVSLLEMKWVDDKYT